MKQTKQTASARKRLILLLSLTLLGGSVFAFAYPLIAHSSGGAVAGY